MVKVRSAKQERFQKRSLPYQLDFIVRRKAWYALNGEWDLVKKWEKEEQRVLGELMRKQRMKKNPLRKGYSRRTISGNVAREVRGGMAPKRAVAASYRTAREAWKARHPHAPFPPYLDYLAFKHNPSEILSGKSIQTEYFGPGNVRGSRIKASVIDGDKIQKTASFGYLYDLDMYENHLKAAEAMRDKMGWDGDLIGVGTRKGYVFGFKHFARSFRKNPDDSGRGIHIDIDSHNAAKGARYKMNAKSKRGGMSEGEAIKQYGKNAREKHAKHIKVECERGGHWHTVALFPLSPEGKANAKRFAKIYHRKYPGRAIRAVY